MAKENLEQWASRMQAAHVSAQAPRPQLNRRSLADAEVAKRKEQAAWASHAERMTERAARVAAAAAAKTAAASTPSRPAAPPSLGGGFISRVMAVVMPAIAEQRVAEAAPAKAAQATAPSATPPTAPAARRAARPH